eukprot:517464-Prymnesium_polylepis.1
MAYGDNCEEGLGLDTLRQGAVCSDENDVRVDSNKWVPRLRSQLVSRGVKNFVRHDYLLHEVARGAIDRHATDSQEIVVHDVNHPDLE